MEGDGRRSDRVWLSKQEGASRREKRGWTGAGKLAKLGCHLHPSCKQEYVCV